MTLDTDGLYTDEHGRNQCASCAGHTARTTGRSTAGIRLQRYTLDDVIDWIRTIGDAPHCDCGRITLTITCLDDTWPAPEHDTY